MSMTSSLAAGLSIGLSVAAPVGPMSMMCIQKTLSKGILIGFTTGLGAATVHLSYSTLVIAGGAGLPAIAHSASLLYLISGLFLFWLARRTVRSPILDRRLDLTSAGLVSTYCSAIGFGLANPMTPIFFAATMPALMGNRGGPTALVVIGVFLGSAGWWLFLTTGISIFRRRVSSTTLRIANKAAALLLAALACTMVVRSCAALWS